MQNRTRPAPGRSAARRAVAKRAAAVLRATAVLAAGAICFAASPADSCTSLIFEAQDGTNIYARTMEWGASDLKSEMMLVPRAMAFKAAIDGGRTGIEWTGKYGFVGINGAGINVATDGMNETGLTVGVLFFPGFADYQAPDDRQQGTTIGIVELANYLLSNFKTVAEVRAAMPGLHVVRSADIEKAFGGPLPLHHVVTDASGDSLVIEYTNGKLTMYDNKVGAMTNSPGYDWHVLNLRNYANLKPQGAAANRNINGVSLAPFGAGSGMLGLPGDFTPPSRFVRAVAFVASMEPVKDAADGINAASAMLNNFDIPEGLVREGADKDILGYTQWSVIGDTRGRVYYYWTKYDRRMRRIDVAKLDFTATKIATFPLDRTRVEDVEDRSADFSH